MARKKIDKELMQKIADRMAVGESLNQILREKNMPTYDGIMKAVVRDDDLFEIYRMGRVLQAEYFTDHINTLARDPMPKFDDVRLASSEMTRRKIEIDALKWSLSRMQPWGIRDKKEDAPQQQSITISWAGGDVAVNGDEAD